MVPQHLLTADELLRLDLPDKRAELVRGRLIVREPAGARHGCVVNDLAYRITHHVKRHGLGRVYAAETGFRLHADPDTVRAPDVAFVARERLPEPGTAGFMDAAPDLVVEVLSPGDRPREVRRKVEQWLAAGGRLVWVVDPDDMSATAYRPDGRVADIEAGGTLSGEDVLPGFACALCAIET